MATTKDIKVTPEMLAAGVHVLHESGAVQYECFGADSVLVKKIFKAMVDAQPLSAAHCDQQEPPQA